MTIDQDSLDMITCCATEPTVMYIWPPHKCHACDSLLTLTFTQ